ncbi:hypothetical protein GOP47_0021254 [Adiantum capillus-veneris]|uniref:Uncharacterized protein n=1 Tax=Adiantum capillus-veneris TaxID=13818 RepID=A0A9D4Z7Q2_ADICA|nr:hypothetical protein GOP47_0021254 [Adiantum capillus-veneris]
MEGVVSVRAATPTALCVATTPSPASSSRSLSCRLPAIRGSLKHKGCNTSSSSLLQETLWAVPAIAAKAAKEAKEKGKVMDDNGSKDNTAVTTEIAMMSHPQGHTCRDLGGAQQDDEGDGSNA